MVDCGESDKMMKISGKVGKLDTYKRFCSNISFFIQVEPCNCMISHNVGICSIWVCSYPWLLTSLEGQIKKKSLWVSKVVFKTIQETPIGKLIDISISSNFLLDKFSNMERYDLLQRHQPIYCKTIAKFQAQTQGLTSLMQHINTLLYRTKAH